MESLVVNGYVDKSVTHLGIRDPDPLRVVKKVKPVEKASYSESPDAGAASESSPPAREIPSSAIKTTGKAARQSSSAASKKAPRSSPPAREIPSSANRAAEKSASQEAIRESSTGGNPPAGKQTASARHKPKRGKRQSFDKKMEAAMRKLMGTEAFEEFRARAAQSESETSEADRRSTRDQRSEDAERKRKSNASTGSDDSDEKTKPPRKKKTPKKVAPSQE